MYLAKVYVTFKSAVNDPVGMTIEAGLKDLGHDSLVSVNSGKYFELRLSSKDEESANKSVTSMCQTLLANTVIENYRFELEPI